MYQSTYRHLPADPDLALAYARQSELIAEADASRRARAASQRGPARRDLRDVIRRTLVAPLHGRGTQRAPAGASDSTRQSTSAAGVAGCSA